MPDDQTARLQPHPDGAQRSGRPPVAAFIADAATEVTLRQGLADSPIEGMTVQRCGIRGAIAALRNMAAPRVLIVDVSGEEQPISALIALSEVVEPDVRVLVIGDRPDANLYRQLTRSLGVAEYLYKPLSADLVAQLFAPFLTSGQPKAAQAQGGRLLTLTSATGGAGATTLAVNLAWHLAVEARRHTLLLDPDLQHGTAALMLGTRTGSGLRTALETPDRVDDLFIERIAEPAAERLSVIAAEENLADRIEAAEGSIPRLLAVLQQRYNYIVVDLPRARLAPHRALWNEARQRVVVMEPTLASVRDTLRLLDLPIGAQQARRSVVVLNKLGAPGAMTRAEVEHALDMKIDLVVPFLPRIVMPAATLGEPAIGKGGAFRQAILLLAREVAAVGAADIAPARRGWRVWRKG